MTCSIVGKGRIGGMLKNILPEAHWIGRSDVIPADVPIIVATRCDDLYDVVERVPVHRRYNLIFVQNGMISSFLHEYNLQECTQALLYVAVAKRGALPVDGGRSVVYGSHASFLAQAFQKGGLICTSVDQERYNQELIEKYVWNCGFGLLCEYFSLSVGEIVEKRREEAEALLWELAQDTAIQLDTSVNRAILERLCAYSMSIFTYRAAPKEWKWRNGWLWSKKQGTLHRDYLQKLNLV